MLITLSYACSSHNVMSLKDKEEGNINPQSARPILSDVNHCEIDIFNLRWAYLVSMCRSIPPQSNLYQTHNISMVTSYMHVPLSKKTLSKLKKLNMIRITIFVKLGRLVLAASMDILNKITILHWRLYPKVRAL